MLQGIKDFIQETFQSAVMSDAEIMQLVWCVRSAVQTPEKSVVKTQDGFIEVRRCTSRLYCLDLLRQGASGYDKFIEPQLALTDKKALTREQYLDLSLNFVSLSPLAVDVLRVSIIISSVPLSPKSKENADSVMGKGKYSEDSVEFLADTFDNIEHAKEIYPLVKALFAKYPEAKDQATLTKLLQAAFAHRQHYRHMLYTEGNDNMFQSVLEGVRSNRLDQEALNFWACHWRINITGFRGHQQPKGSVYLTSETFIAMRALETSLNSVFTSNCVTAKEILNLYLDKRAGFLELQRFQIADDQKRLLAHIASMLRLYHRKEGEVLAASIGFIPKVIMERLSRVYFDCQDKSEPTPIYAPALFENILDFCKKEYHGDKSNQFIRSLAIFNAIVMGVPFYLRALEAYRTKRVSNEIPANTPLCFRDIAQAQRVFEFCGVLPLDKEFDILSILMPQIDSKGMVSSVKVEPSATHALEAATSVAPTLTHAYAKSTPPLVVAATAVASASSAPSSGIVKP